VVEVRVTVEGFGVEQVRPGGLMVARDTVPVNP